MLWLRRLTANGYLLVKWYVYKIALVHTELIFPDFQTEISHSPISRVLGRVVVFTAAASLLLSVDGLVLVARILAQRVGLEGTRRFMVSAKNVRLHYMACRVELARSMQYEYICECG